MTGDALNGLIKRTPGLASLRRRLIATKTFQALLHARLTFFTEPAYCTLGSRLRLTACTVGPARLAKTVRVRLLPFEVDVWLRPRTADIDTLVQVWSQREYDLRISAPATVIDGGANIGLTTVFFALTWPGCRVLSVEPEPRNFDLLERNTRNLPNVRIVKAALWESVRELTVMDRGIGVNAYYVVAGRAADALHPASMGTTVDGLCDEEGWGALDVLKLDIEGAEVEGAPAHPRRGSTGWESSWSSCTIATGPVAPRLSGPRPQGSASCPLAGASSRSPRAADKLPSPK